MKGSFPKCQQHKLESERNQNTFGKKPLPKQTVISIALYMSSIGLIRNNCGLVSANRGCPIRAPGVTT